MSPINQNNHPSLDIKIEHISVVLNNKRILDDISCEFPPNAWTHVVGANGAGKSTLLKVLAGIVPEATGAVYAGNADLSRLSPARRAQIIAYVPQRIEAFPPLKAVRFVAQGLYAHRMPARRSDDDACSRAYACMAAMHLEHLAHRPMNRLSGGECQMLVLCSTVLQDSDILLLDEPTSSLDMQNTRQFYDIVLSLLSRGKTIISISHDIRQTASYADNIFVMKDGKCLEFAKREFPSNKVLSNALGPIPPEDWAEIQNRRQNRQTAMARLSPDSGIAPSLPINLPFQNAPGKPASEPENLPPGDSAGPAHDAPALTADLRRREIRAICLSYGLLFALILGLPWVGATLLACPFDEIASQVFWDLRIPRVLLATLAGGVLASVGAAFQALFQNPLASPYTLGVAGGASLGAMIAIQLGVLSPVLLPALATLGGMLSLLAVIAIASRFGLRSPVYCLLAGIATSMFCSACGLAVQAFATPLTAQQMMRWQLGGLEIAGYSPFAVVPAVILALLALMRSARPLDLLAVDSDLAQSRGVDVARTRLVVIVAASAAASIVVSLCGPIGFIGLIVPNAVRSAFGADMRTTLALSLPIGAISLLIADAGSRLLESLTWIPVGVIVSLAGVPIFLFFLFKMRQNATI